MDIVNVSVKHHLKTYFYLPNSDALSEASCFLADHGNGSAYPNDRAYICVCNNAGILWLMNAYT